MFVYVCGYGYRVWWLRLRWLGWLRWYDGYFSVAGGPPLMAVERFNSRVERLNQLIPFGALPVDHAVTW